MQEASPVRFSALYFLHTKSRIQELHTKPRFIYDEHFMNFPGLVPFIGLVYLNIRILISLRNLRSRLNTRCQETRGCDPAQGKASKVQKEQTNDRMMLTLQLKLDN